MRMGVYIQSNRRQRIGAMVSAYSMKRATSHPDKFSITILSAETSQYSHLFRQAEGKTFLREGKVLTWRNDVLQSFPPLRFTPPEIQDFEGRAVVVDPDVFAYGDVYELLRRNMLNKAILCRTRSTNSANLTTSVMLLDCGKLVHWKLAALFERLLNKEIEWVDWMRLKGEDPDTIGFFEPEWNDFDNLTPATKLLHNTKQNTQPWRTGLVVERKARRENKRLLGRWKEAIQNLSQPRERHQRHPDLGQEVAFFALLREAMENGEIARHDVERAIAAGEIRPDALQLADRAPTLPRASSEIAAFVDRYRRPEHMTLDTVSGLQPAKLG